RWRRVLVEVADAGCFEPDRPSGAATGPVARLAERALEADSDTGPERVLDQVEPERLAAKGDTALLLGEASLETVAAAAHPVGRCRVLPGWMRADDVDTMRAELRSLGGALVDLPGRRGATPPTEHTEGRA